MSFNIPRRKILTGGALMGLFGAGRASASFSPPALALTPGQKAVLLTASSAPAYSLPFYDANLNPTQLPNLRKGLANVRRGVAPLRLLHYGTSISRGYSAQASNDFSNGFPSQIAKIYCSKFGLTGNWDSIFGCGGGSLATLAAYDTRFSTTGGFAPGGGANNTSAGGATFNATGAGSFSFLPTDNFDSFRIWYSISTSLFGGTFSWQVDGGAATNIVTTGANALGNSGVLSAGASGAHTIALNWVSGTVQIIGIETWVAANLNSTVSILNGGSVGMLASNCNFATNPWSQINNTFLTTLAPQAMFLEFGANEEISAISPATFTTNMQAIITAAQTALIDVILVVHNPIVTTSASLASQQAMIAAMYALASANNCPIIDCWQRWGSTLQFTALQTAGWYGNSPFIHPSALGYGDMADQIAQLVFGM